METTIEKKVQKNTKSSYASLLALLDANLLPKSTTGKARIDGQEIEYRTVVIDSELAKQLLELNVVNRPMALENLNHLKREILKGNWDFDGAPIRFNSLGQLSDGQHRLTTLVDCEETEIFQVITGLKPEVFKTMDTGRKRTGSDVLGIEGVRNSAAVASTCKFVDGYYTGKYGYNKNSNRSLSNTELIDFFEKHNTGKNPIEDSVTLGVSLSGKGEKIITPTLASGFHFLFSRLDKEQADEFIEKLCCGNDLSNDSPIKALRHKLLRVKLEGNFSLTHTEVIQNIIYAWNKFRSGEKVKKLYVPEKFDMVIK